MKSRFCCGYAEKIVFISTDAGNKFFLNIPVKMEKLDSMVKEFCWEEVRNYMIVYCN